MDSKAVRRIKAVRDQVLAMPGMTRAVQLLTVRQIIPRPVWLRLQPIGVVTVRPASGAPFLYRATAADAMAKSVVWEHMRRWDISTQPVLVDLARTARVFVDGGTYTGVYTLLATAVNPDLRVVAFEANPPTARLLRGNLALNGLEGRVRVVEEAISDQVGMVDFFIPDDDPTAAALTSAGTRIRVPSTPADVHLAGLEVDLVKIDLEGHEPAALRGMAETLKRCRPALILECLTAAALPPVRAVLDPLGYHDCLWLGPSGPVRADATVDCPRPFYPNFLFRARDAAAPTAAPTTAQLGPAM